jgi:predicted RNA-binding Zn-ribbon protein involved in translation (DUF1610 family)
MDLYKTVREVMGYRYKHIEQDDDEHQEFWVGLLIAKDKNPDAPIPHLIKAGYWALKDYRKRERTKDLASYCEKCNKSWGARNRYCPNCGSETIYIRRKVEYFDTHRSRHKDSVLEQMMVEQFVETQTGTAKYIAKRWMLERADLFYKNYQEQLAWETGISQQSISKHIKKLKRRFVVFYYGCTEDVRCLLFK